MTVQLMMMLLVLSQEEGKWFYGRDETKGVQRKGGEKIQRGTRTQPSPHIHSEQPESRINGNKFIFMTQRIQSVVVLIKAMVYQYIED